MKKFLALVLVLVMMLSLAACGGKSFTVVGRQGDHFPVQI